MMGLNRQEIASLAELRFGDDVAEHDTGLDNYFLRTNAFWALVQDESDLILGAKGTGKSAIARYLSNPEVTIDEIDDVDIIPAFNIRGSVLFRRLVGAVPRTEAEYRDIFLAYIAGLVGNYLVTTYESAAHAERLDHALKALA